MFAYAVLKLVEEGKLDLDAPVMKYLPHGYRHRFHPVSPSSRSDLFEDSRSRAITVRAALNHTSGLPNWAQGPLFFDVDPGTAWNYSGEGYALLQRAVETVTGKTLDRFMRAQVFQPLGMDDSGYVWQDRFEQRVLSGTTRDDVSITPWRFAVPVAAFSLYSSVEDYGKFLAAVLNDGHAMRHIVASPVPVRPDLDLSWGLGWGLQRRDDELFIWHWGNNPGYRAFIIASVRTGDGVVMLTNSDDGLKLAEPMTNRILPGPHKVFRFPMLREGLANLLCDMFDVCI